MTHQRLPVPIRSTAASPGPFLWALRVAAPPAHVMDVGRQPPLDEQHVRTQALRLRVIITATGAQAAGIRGPGPPYGRFTIRDNLRGGEPRPYRGDIIKRRQQAQTPGADEEVRQQIRNARSRAPLGGSIRMIPFFDFSVTFDSHRVPRVRGRRLIVRASAQRNNLRFWSFAEDFSAKRRVSCPAPKADTPS